MPVDPKLIAALNRIASLFNESPNLSAALLWPYKEELAAIREKLANAQNL